MMRLKFFKEKLQRNYLAFTSVILLIFTRFYSLGFDVVGFDDFHFKNWSYVFMKEFEAHKWKNLLVTIQPGALTIYSNVIGFKVLYFLSDKLHIFNSSSENFELIMNTFQKIPQTTLIVFLQILSAWLIYKLLNKKIALFYLLISAFEPMFIAHSRVIQTDMLQALLMFNSALFTILFIHQNKIKYILLAGLTGGLAFIEKSPSIILLGIIPSILFVDFAINKFNKKLIWKYLRAYLIYTGIFFATSYALFPAFWFHPIETFRRMTIDAYLFGVSGINTETYSYDRYVSSSYLSYDYIYFLIYRFTPVYWLGLLLGICFAIKSFSFKLSEKKRSMFYMILFAFLYFLLLQVSQKKFERYFLVSALPLAVVSAYGFSKLSEIKKIFNTYIIAAVFCIYGIFNYFYWTPDFIAYSNFLHKFVYKSQVIYDWGAGYYKLSEHLKEKYGSHKTVAVGDPMSLVLFYHSKVSDLAVSDYSEDILIYSTTAPYRTFGGYTEVERFGLHNEPYFIIYTKNP